MRPSFLGARRPSWAHCRHTTAEMAGRVTAAVQQRLTVVLQVAEHTLEPAQTGQR
jgi:hypothetical protein